MVVGGPYNRTHEFLEVMIDHRSYYLMLSVSGLPFLYIFFI